VAVVESNKHGATERWIVYAHRGNGKRFVQRADEKLTAFPELDSAIRPNATDHFALPGEEISDEPARNLAGRTCKPEMNRDLRYPQEK
jgi:hypothetical protein